MPQSELENSSGRAWTKFILLVVALLAILLFVLTYIGIQRSRGDSLQLVKQQAAALIESLTLSSENAIKASSFFDLLVQEKFSDLVGFLETYENMDLSSPELADFASGYGVDAILIFDSEMNLKASGARGIFVDLNNIYGFVIPEMESLLSDPAGQSSFQIIEGELPTEVSVYYLAKTSDRKFIVAIVSDALFYSEAKKSIGIGYLIQNIADEVGIEYILFQTLEGIVFSSRKIDPILKIEKDSFLKEALDTDSILSREQIFNDRRILELVKRFSSVEYGEGLFRLGVSLEKYYDIVAGYDRQMIVLSGVIFAVLVLSLFYLTGKQKRIYLDRSFKRMKSLSEKVFDNINAGLIAVGKEGKIEMANNQFLTVFDIQEDIIGKQWENYPFENIIPFAEILSGRRSAGEMESILSVSAGKKHLLINTGKLYDHANRLSGVVAVVYDYTRIRELEAAARRKERLTELGDLAAGVAHEIRNPLNAISIAAQRLLSEFEPKENVEEFKSFSRQIKSEADRLNEIVARFLSMAKGKGQIVDRINISKVVEETIELASLGLEEKKITVKSNIEPAVTASISEDRFKQLVINLIKNAVEACERKGGDITVTLVRQGGQAVLSIVDTGVGIPDDIKEKIFSPYFTTKEKGTGLGLSIVYQVVEEFGGQVDVLSPPDGGTEFRIRFP